MDHSIRIRYLGSGEPDRKTGRLVELEDEINKFLEAGEEVISVTPCVVAVKSALAGIKPVNLFAVVTKLKND